MIRRALKVIWKIWFTRYGHDKNLLTAKRQGRASQRHRG